MVVQEPGDAVLGGDVHAALHIAAEGQGGDGHVQHHKDHQQPGEDFSRLHGQPLNQVGQPGVEHLDPHHRGDAPEEAVEQVDPAAQVEGDVAVIPEDRAEHQLGEDGTAVLIGASQHGAEQEQKSVPAVPVAVEQNGEDHRAEAPHDGEGAVEQAAAALPLPHGEAAEDGLKEVAQQGGDHKDPGQLVEAAALGEHLGADLLLPPLPLQAVLIQAGVGPGHTPLDVPGDRVVQGVGHRPPPPGDLAGLLQAAVELEQRGARPGKVRRQQDQHRNDDDPSHRLGNPVGEGYQQGVAQKQAEQGQNAPHQGVFQTDVAVEVPGLLGVVPPLLPEDALQQGAGDQLQGGGQQHAAHKQEEGGAFQLREEHGEQHGGLAVNGGEGGVQKAAVEQLALFRRRGGGLHQPAQEGVDQKEPEQLVECVFHRGSLCIVT